MSAVERIEAALDEAEKRLDAATTGRWTKHGGFIDAGEVSQIASVLYAGKYADADLIVSVVNRERAQIQHARDVLAAHADGGESQGYFDGRYSERDHCCQACGTFGEYGVEWPCAPVLALLAVWCPEPTP